MNPHDFISRWNAFVKAEQEKAIAAGVPDVADEFKLVTAPPSILNIPFFPADAAQFLINVGLPGSCAPFLSFEEVARGPLSLVAYYGAHQFEPADAARLALFYVLGLDSGGNPLCLDVERSGEIVMLDHEDGFRTRTYVASGVAALAEALLVLHTLPQADFVSRLRAIDPHAAETSAYLPAEVGMLTS